MVGWLVDGSVVKYIYFEDVCLGLVYTGICLRRLRKPMKTG
jgi:hypothetical protein